MRRRDVLALFTLPSITSAEAQQSWLRRIGILMASEPVDSQALGFLQALRTGLADLGWREGSNLEIELRFAPRPDLLGPELAQRRVELIVTHGTPPVQAIGKRVRQFQSCLPRSAIPSAPAS